MRGIESLSLTGKKATLESYWMAITFKAFSIALPI